MNIPNILTEISDYLSKQNMVLSKQFDDGRINASINESEVIKTIKHKFSIDIPKSRAWFDFSITDSNNFILLI